MSKQQGRKRDAWKLPGEGTGVYGVDPLVFLKPGDNAEVDQLLDELRTDCDEGDPFFVDYGKRSERKLKAPAKREERGAAMKRKGGVSLRWLGYATVAIVGPAVMLLLVTLLPRRPAVTDAPREAEDRGAARGEETPAPSPATVPSIGTSAEAIGSAPSPRAPGGEKAAALSTSEPTPAGPSSRAVVGRSKPRAQDPDPYAMDPKPREPLNRLEVPEPAPGETRGAIEKPDLTSAPAVEKPEAEF